MGDLIYRQVAIDAFKKKLTIEESKENYITTCSAIGYKGIKQILESLPSAQLERNWAKWNCVENRYIEIFQCSQCKSFFNIATRFCPYCGATMLQWDIKKGDAK